MESSRLFVAVPIIATKELEQTLNSLQFLLRNEKIAWSSASKYHLTLRFIGLTNNENIPHLNAALNNCTKGLGSFTLKTKGLSIFNRNRTPHTLWMGFANCTELQLLYNDLQKTLTALALKPEPKAFRPHVTLARIPKLKNKRIFTDAIEQCASIGFGDYQIDSFFLFKSTLTTQGAIHEVISEFTL